MDIKEIIKNNKKTEIDVNGLFSKIPSSKDLLLTLMKTGVNIAFMIKDFNDRSIVISAGGVYQYNMSYGQKSSNLDALDGGLVSCGVYEDFLDRDENIFDYIVVCDVDLITCGKDMTGYVLIENIPSDIDLAIEDCDEEEFESYIDSLTESEYIYIPALSLINE